MAGLLEEAFGETPKAGGLLSEAFGGKPKSGLLDEAFGKPEGDLRKIKEIPESGVAGDLRKIKEVSAPDVSKVKLDPFEAAIYRANDTLKDKSALGNTSDFLAAIADPQTGVLTELGKGLEREGAAIPALLADIGTFPIETGESKFRNVKAVFKDEQPPYEQEMKNMPVAARMVESGIAGIMKTAPEMAVYSADPFLGAMSFGLTPEGFSPKQAVVAGIIPFIGKYSGAIAENLAAKAGIGSDAALNVINKAGGAGTVAAAITADQAHEIFKLPKEQQKDAWIDAIGNVAAMTVLGIFGKRHQFTTDKLMSRLNQQVNQGKFRDETGDLRAETALSPRLATWEASAMPQIGAPADFVKVEPSERVKVTPDMLADLQATLKNKMPLGQGFQPPKGVSAALPEPTSVFAKPAEKPAKIKLRPALLINGQPVIGGDTHKEIMDNQVALAEANGDKESARMIEAQHDDDSNHVFVPVDAKGGVIGEHLNREEAWVASGREGKGKLHSEDLLKEREDLTNRARQILEEARQRIQKRKESIDEFKKKHGEVTFQGTPEKLDEKRKAYIVVSPEPTEQGKWRYTIFDKDGASSHRTHDTWEEAVNEAVKDFGLKLDDARISKPEKQKQERLNKKTVVDFKLNLSKRPDSDLEIIKNHIYGYGKHQDHVLELINEEIEKRKLKTQIEKPKQEFSSIKIGDTIEAKSHQIKGLVHKGKIVSISGDEIQIINEDNAPVIVLRKNITKAKPAVLPEEPKPAEPIKPESIVSVKPEPIIPAELKSGIDVQDNWIEGMLNRGYTYAGHKINSQNKLVIGNSSYITLISPDGKTKLAFSTDVFGEQKGDVHRYLQNKKDGFHIEAIVTDPKARGKGGASKMMKDVVEVADAVGTKLTAEIAPIKIFIKKGQKNLNKAELRKWYEKLGFESDGISLIKRNPKTKATEPVVPVEPVPIDVSKAIDAPKDVNQAAGKKIKVYHGSAEIARKGKFEGLVLNISPAGKTREIGASADSMGTWWSSKIEDAVFFGKSIENGEGAILYGEIIINNPKIFYSENEAREFFEKFREDQNDPVKKPIRGDKIKSYLESQGYDGLILKGGEKGITSGDYYLSFNNKSVNVVKTYFPPTKAKPPVFKKKLYQGRGAKPEDIYGAEAVAEGRAVPILGKGDYYAETREDAQIYGKVTAYDVELSNPIVIDSDAKWRQLLKDANTPALDSRGETWYKNPELIAPSTIKLQEYLKSKGYDGAIVKIGYGDVNERGESVKGLVESFGHSQVVKFATEKPVEAVKPEEIVAKPIELPKIETVKGQTEIVLNAENVKTTAKIDTTKTEFSPKQAKEQKKFLLDAVDQAIKEAPEKRPEVQADKDILLVEEASKMNGKETRSEFEARRKKILDEIESKYDFGEFYKNKPDDVKVRLLLGDKDSSGILKSQIVYQSPIVTIKIPKDGVYSVINSKETLKQFRDDHAVGFPTSGIAVKTSGNVKVTQTKPAVLGSLKKENILKASSISISEDTSRGDIVHIFSDGEVTVSTDGRRLLIVNAEIGGTSKNPILIDEKGNEVKSGSAYPNWKQIVPKDNEIDTIVDSVDSEKLFQSVRQAQEIVTEKEKSITLHRNPDGTIGISAVSEDIGEYGSSLQKGAKIIANIDPQYLLDGINALRLIGDETFSIKSKFDQGRKPTTGLAPIILVGKNGKYIVMPFRGKDDPEVSTHVTKADLAKKPKTAKEMAEMDVLDVEQEGKSAANAVADFEASKVHPIPEPDSGLPPNVRKRGKTFTGQLLEATRVIGALARYKAMKGGVLGAFFWGGAEDKIHMGNIRNQRTMAHEFGHAVENTMFPFIKDKPYTALGKKFNLPESIVRGEIIPISEMLRGKIAGSKRFIEYRRQGKELFADFMCLYIHDPELARSMAPKFTEAFEKEVIKHPDVKILLDELNVENVTPVAAKRISAPTGKPAGMTGKLPARGKPADTYYELDLAIKAQGIVVEAVRMADANKQAAQIKADKWQKLVPDVARRNDVGAFIEGIGNLEIAGDTIADVVARMTPEMRELAIDYRKSTEETRQDINILLRNYGEAEYLKFLKDYLPHFYQGSSRKIASAITSWAKKSSSAKERKLPTLREAVELGLKPISQDPSELYAIYTSMNWRVAAARKVLGELKNLKGKDGNAVVLPKDLAPEDWVLMNHPLIQITWATGSRSKLMLWRTGAMVHPDVAPALKQILERPTSSMAGRFYDALNSATRLGVFAGSLFHDFTLRLASVGAMLQLHNPLRGLVLLNEFDPITGERKLFQSTRKVGVQALENEDVVKEAVYSGLKLSDHRDADQFEMGAQSALDNILRRVKDIKGVGKAIDLYQWRQKALWRNTHDAYKMIAWMDLVSKGIDKEIAASYINDAFGGQEKQAMFWASPSVQKLMGRLLLAPDWTISTLKSVPFISDATSWMASKVVKGYAPRYEGWKGNQLRMRFWASELSALAIGSIFTQWALYQTFGDKSKGDKPFVWENQSGEKFSIDITPALRMMPWHHKDDLTRHYINLGKRASEIIRWATDPLAFVPKLAQPIQEITKQISGVSPTTELGIYPASWVLDNKVKFYSIPDRVVSAGSIFLPFALRGNQFALSVPMHKGASAVEETYQNEAKWADKSNNKELQNKYGSKAYLVNHQGYSNLRALLIAGDYEGSKKEIQKLESEGRNINGMRISLAPTHKYAGKYEAQFVNSLTDQQKSTYAQAKELRQYIWQRFAIVYNELHPPSPNQAALPEIKPPEGYIIKK